jgi:hypothetical protein
VPTVIDAPTPAGLTRRALLAWLGSVACAPVLAHDGGTLLAASWLEHDRHLVGLLRLDGAGLQVQATLALPTRAHGLAIENDGGALSVLVAARRPGDWLLRWQPASGRTAWHWIDDDRVLNGHALPSPRGRTVWTTETDQADASGLIGVRDGASLRKTAEWRTHGMDPHAMLALPEALGGLPAGTLVVANGGIPTQSETGRSHRDLSRMDPSLVALHPGTGELLGQWRLPDPRLSIRHLAFDPVGRRVGIAMQAEHDDETRRRDAPLLATWDGRGLTTAAPAPGALGYGGDICARAGGGFWLSATRANQLLGYSPQGEVVARVALPAAGALAARNGHAWAGGAAAMWCDDGAAPATALNFDNHWVPARGV